MDIAKEVERRLDDLALHGTYTPEFAAKLKIRYGACIPAYYGLVLNLPIDNVPVRRLCQAMTNNRYETTDSCDGHGKTLPNIWFRCDDLNHLRHLAHIVARDSYITQFRWQIRAWSATPSSNTPIRLGYSGLSFILEPSISAEKVSLPQDYSNLLTDLDMLGICITDYFRTK